MYTSILRITIHLQIKLLHNIVIYYIAKYIVYIMYIPTNLNAFVYSTCAYKTLSESSPLYVHGDIIQLGWTAKRNDSTCTYNILLYIYIRINLLYIFIYMFVARPVTLNADGLYTKWVAAAVYSWWSIIAI